MGEPELEVPIEQIKKPEAFMKPKWWDDDFADNYDGRTKSLLRDFVTGNLTGHRAMTYKNFRHVYYTKEDGNQLWLHKDNKSLKIHVCVARKVGDVFIGNGSSFTFQKNNETGKVTPISHGRLKIQEFIEDMMVMVPFQTFKEAQLDLDSMVIVDRGGPEFLNVKRRKWSKESEDIHFMGSLLFKIEVRMRSREIQSQREAYYLFDIDRNDVAVGVMNPFLSKLSRPVTSIADAYDSLKPQEIKDAERFLGKPCPRHGEWFFVPVQGEFTPLQSESRDKTRWEKTRAQLSNKGSRPHFVSDLSQEGYVRGKVWHGGGEHEDIELPTWHKPCGNGAVESFKISGAID